MSWRAYRAWIRACLMNAWRATRGHFGGGWRSAMEVLGPGFATSLALYMWSGGADPALDNVLTIATGAAVSVLWIAIVLCWNFGLAPYRLWRAARERIAHLQMAVGRRIDRQAIARQLDLCIKEGTALMDFVPTKSQLSEWYEGVLRVVSRASPRDRAMLETLGPAPGTRGGALELLILSNRIEKLRLIRDRQYRAAREQALRMNAGVRQSSHAGQLRAGGQRSSSIRAPRTPMIATSRRR